MQPLSYVKIKNKVYFKIYKCPPLVTCRASTKKPNNNVTFVCFHPHTPLEHMTQFRTKRQNKEGF